MFLQGCTFDCLACHNPYTINPCVDCGECVPGCPSGALGFDAAGKVTWDAHRCAGGEQCITGMPVRLLPQGPSPRRERPARAASAGRGSVLVGRHRLGG
ncbi:MAG: hypothetical protein V9F04_03360 [Dermatophilaceae bacterium]